MDACVENKVLLWLKIVRPQTLPASLCPVAVGLIVSGIQRPWVAVITAFCALSLQIFSNLVNDYYDFARGTDKKGRAGFKRALAEGLVTRKQMLCACVVSFVLAVLSGLYLVFAGGWPVLLIGVTALLFAWLYTATGHSLSYLGIADIFVFLYYGIIASTGTAWLQLVPDVQWPALLQSMWAGAGCGLMSMCVLITNNVRDIETDRLAGKRTFPVRFGKRAGETGYLVVVLLVPVAAYLAFGWCWAMFALVPALALYRKFLRSEGAQYNKCLMLAGLLNILYVILCFFSV